MEIYAGELICDAKGNFAGYPKIEKELKNDVQTTIVREKIIQLKQLHFLKAKKEFLDTLVKNDDAKSQKSLISSKKKASFLIA